MKKKKKGKTSFQNMSFTSKVINFLQIIETYAAKKKKLIRHPRFEDMTPSSSRNFFLCKNKTERSPD